MHQRLALYQQGQLNDATRIYRAVLTRHLNHLDALHSLGMAALQAGQTEFGINLIRKAIAPDGNIAGVHVTLCNRLRDLGRLDETRASFDRGPAGAGLRASLVRP